LKILSFSYCFPNAAKPSWGMFVLQRLAALSRHPDVQVQVVAPVPVFPLVSHVHTRLPPNVERKEQLNIYHPRYFYIPKWFKSRDGRFYGHGLRRWLAVLRESFDPDILDAHFVWPDGVGVSMLAQHFALPYAITLRGWLYEAMKYPPIIEQCRTALFGASVIIAVSNHLAETAIGLGIPPERVRVIPNGVDTERFRLRDKNDARHQLGLREDVRVVVSVGHLGTRKGHRETIKALAHLPDDVYLVIVGGEPGRQQNEQGIRKLINDLGLQRRVMLVGQQAYDRVPLFYSAADLSVLASYREGCPNVVLESLASGTPVVASAVGSIPDMIEEGRNGRTVPPQQVQSLAEAMREMLELAPDRQNVRRSHAVRSWDEVARDVRETLQAAMPSSLAEPKL
jgi:glycosyltransferase involved in cell wall biosynthesis